MSVCIYIYVYILCVCVHIYINTEQGGLSHNFSGFPGSSADKESASNAGDPGSIPGLGRSPGEGNSYLLQYSWTSLVAQIVKNLPAMQETWNQSLGWEDPPGDGKSYTLQYSCLENSIDRGALLARVRHNEQLSLNI